jgi:cell wall-associated NlpC family hydrolase
MQAAHRGWHTAGVRIASKLRSRPALVAVVALLAAGVTGAALALAGQGSDQPGQQLPAPSRAAEQPLPAPRAKAVEPEAGVASDAGAGADAPLDPAEEDLDAPVPKPTGSASGSSRKDVTGSLDSAGAPATKARALAAGVAIPPLEAPDAIRSMIAAGNTIARTPYLWGGGHGRWVDKGYDCSGSVSYVLAAAGLLSGPLDSGRLMGWGKAGKGRWVTVYSNPGHVFLEVAGIRFDTSGARVTGSRWQSQGRSTAGFVARHWPGL